MESAGRFLFKAAYPLNVLMAKFMRKETGQLYAAAAAQKTNHFVMPPMFPQVSRIKRIQINSK
jgi:hypothetical protein